jgi:TonB family protein
MRRSAAGAFVLLLACAGGLADPETVQRGWSEVLAPAPVRPGAGAADPAPQRVLRIRAFADAEFQATTPRWRERIAEQVTRSNAVVGPEFGVRLVLDSVRPWGRGARGGSLESIAVELMRLDPAADVDWVVGFAGPVPEDTGAFHESVGLAEMFGRHFVVRAMQSAADVALIDASYDQLTPERRQAIAREQRIHREQAVFLHEWAHTLGAVHECEDKWIMTREYSLLQSSFSPRSARFVRLGLQRRGAAGAAGLREWARAWRAEAQAQTGASWDCRALEEGLAGGEATLSRELERVAVEARSRYAAAILRQALAKPWNVRRPPPREVSFDLEVLVDATGALKDVRLVTGSGDRHLDDAALQRFRESEPFEAPPPELLDDGHQARLTVGFKLDVPRPAPGGGGSEAPAGRDR